MSTTLFVKGSNCGRKGLGDCFKCQRMLLIMRLKDENFEVRYINERTKQIDKTYRGLCSTMTPVLTINDEEFQDANEIADVLESQYVGEYSLKSDNIVANNLASKATPMSSLVGWIKNTDPKRDEIMENKFRKTLYEIDQVLGSTEGDFLDGDRIKLPDCILLPKLYHAKIAAKHVKDYDFTIEFKNIGRYLDAAQKNSAFQETCPEECEILEKWRDKIPKK